MKSNGGHWVESSCTTTSRGLAEKEKEGKEPKMEQPTCQWEKNNVSMV